MDGIKWRNGGSVRKLVSRFTSFSFFQGAALGIRQQMYVPFRCNPPPPNAPSPPSKSSQTGHAGERQKGNARGRQGREHLGRRNAGRGERGQRRRASAVRERRPVEVDVLAGHVARQLEAGSARGCEPRQHAGARGRLNGAGMWNAASSAQTGARLSLTCHMCA